MTWEFLQRWYMPFVWITLASIISVPVAVYFQNGMTLHTGEELGLGYGSAWAVRDDVLASIVIYMLNLGAVIWLFNADGSTRWAAFWATLVGAGRLVSPIMLASMADVSIAGNQHYVDWQTLRILIWFQDAQMFALGLMVWMAFARFVGEGGPVASHFAHAEA
jgi:hypothetical protein